MIRGLKNNMMNIQCGTWVQTADICNITMWAVVCNDKVKVYDSGANRN